MKHRMSVPYGRRGLLVAAALVTLAAVAVANGSVHALRSHSTRALRTHAAAVTPDGQVPGYLDLKETSGGHKVTRAMYLRAQRQARAISTGQTAPWQFVGPTNIGGRVDDLAVDTTTTPTTVYTAVTSGGVWKSTDSGVNWTSVWPNSLPQSIGALARSSNGTLYAGTGESNPSGGGTTIMGAGIYKSTDNGATWQDLGLHDSGAFGRIVVSPTNPNEVWAAATGALSWDSSQRGLYHSTDAGQTWSLAIAPVNIKSGAIDVQVDPTNPNIILASMWDRYRNNGSFFYGGIGSGLYRSSDGGATWTRLNNTNITGSLCNWDNNDANGTNHTVPATGLDPEGRTSTNDGGLGRIGIAWSSPTAVDPQANRVYIVTAGANGPDKGFYVSDDAGATWHCGGARAGTQNAGYEWVFGRQWVDPANENHIFDADVSLRVSTNGGASWATSSGPHSDHHAQIWDPQVPNRAYNGDDGGVYFSPTNGNSGTWTHATNEAWNQPYHIAVSQQDSNRLALGLQDQGCVRTWRPGVPNANLTQWNSTANCGDGHWVLINPTNQLQYFGCSQPTPPTINCTRVTDAAVSGSTTSTSSSFTGNPGWGSNARITTDTPIAIDPADTAYVYTGGVSVVRSPNGAVTGTWALLSNPTPLTEPQTQTSPPSLPGPIPQNQINVDTFYANEYGAVTFIAPAKSTGTATTPCSTIYVGTDTGLLWKTTDAVVGSTYNSATPVHWTQLGAGVLPQRWVTGIQVDPTDANHVIASFSAYKDGDRAVNVWESKDGGATWSNISRNLPNAPLWMITFDKTNGLLYASSDFGVFSLYDTNPSANWLQVGTNLPNAPVFDTQLSGDKQTVFASTFGRGVYKVAATQDTDAPVTTATTAPAAPNGTNGWFTTPVQVTLAATDGDGSGVASTQYRVDGGAWTPYTAPFTVSGEGAHVVDYASTDTLGNAEATKSLALKIDTVKPTTGFSLSPATPGGSNGWYLGPVQVTLSPSDATSGVGSTTYTVDGGAAQTYSAPFTLSSDGDHVVRFSSTDNAGNAEDANVVHVKVDQNDPVTTGTLTPGIRNGWYASPTLTLPATDGAGSGVAHTDYALDGGSWTTYSGPISGFTTGNHFVQYRSTDNAGRVEATKLLAFKVDAVKPSVTITAPADGAQIPLDKVTAAKFKCTDNESGMDTCVGTVANGANLDTSSVGDHAFTVTATDKAGNQTVRTVHYQVVYRFNGFFSPVTNTGDGLNLVHAGDLVKIGFGLDGNRGLNVFAGGFPKSEAIACPSDTPHSVPAGGAGTDPGLQYGVASGHYTYGWQTDAGWAGTCRRFEIQLNDGTSTLHTADFMFFA